MILHLDQAFGGWKIASGHRHDFRASARMQVMQIAPAAFEVTGGMAGAPIALSNV